MVEVFSRRAGGGMMPDFDDDEYESFDLEDSGDDSEAEAESDDLDTSDEDELEDASDEDELEDAAPDEIDFVLAAYREDGQPMVQALAADLANDLDELIIQLRRLPGDAGAVGFVSLVEDVFAIVRVRGQHVQLLLSDGGAATEWPIARDIADMLAEDIPDPDEEEAEPMGDLGILSDLGISDFEMGTIIDNLDMSSDQMLTEIADKIKIGPQFRKASEAAFPA
jgi:putative tRNA adenosine deaminase-associated protein